MISPVLTPNLGQICFIHEARILQLRCVNIFNADGDHFTYTTRNAATKIYISLLLPFQKFLRIKSVILVNFGGETATVVKVI
jgi:hypothetical protein